jgi:hypothetical protein
MDFKRVGRRNKVPEQDLYKRGRFGNMCLAGRKMHLERMSSRNDSET